MVAEPTGKWNKKVAVAQFFGRNMKFNLLKFEICYEGEKMAPWKNCAITFNATFHLRPSINYKHCILAKG